MQVSLWEIFHSPHNYCKIITIKYCSEYQGKFDQKRNKFLGKVKKYITTKRSYKNISYKSHYDQSQNFYESVLSIDEILSHSGLTRAEYEDALSEAATQRCSWEKLCNFIEITLRHGCSCKCAAYFQNTFS